MKNTFTFGTLVLVLGYPTLLAAESAGLLPFNVPSFAAFICCFSTWGILGIAFADYSRKASYDAAPVRKRLAKTAPVARRVATPVNPATYQTISA